MGCMYSIGNNPHYLANGKNKSARMKDAKRRLIVLCVVGEDNQPMLTFTDVKELIEKYDKFRYVSPTDLKINFEVLIYNDVYATYTYKGDEIFCVEIYNPQLAEMQKQLFDFIWSGAKKMQFVDERGGAEVEL